MEETEEIYEIEITEDGIYGESINEMVEDGEISSEEAGFMQGYMGA
jgi:hypothetical protein|tara:strand:+ start:793 stop:930 length:138 start_codon:yes stop_codon:yes gene_type:complete